MRAFLVIVLHVCCLLSTPDLLSQSRVYAPSSVLSTGIWHSLITSEEGIYKVDGAMLTKMGISLPFPSSQLRLYGNGGKMLPEANGIARPDDLMENAILVEDGGDGSFHTQDYFFFYTPGTADRSWDSTENRFRSQKNLYSDSARYFLMIGGQGKRVKTAAPISANKIITEADAFYVYEKDDLNFLQSGKEWFGEEFGTGSGRVNAREFTIPVQHIIPNTPMILSTEILGRTIGGTSQFDVRVNNNSIYSLIIPSLTGGAYEPVGSPVYISRSFTTSASTVKINLVFTPGNSSALGWLNKFEWNGRIKLDMSSTKQLSFRDARSRNEDAVRFSIDNTPSGTRVWDVTDFVNPVEQVITKSGNTVQYNAMGKMIREYVAFNADRALIPVIGPKIPNQDLHGIEIPQYIIVTHHSFINEAKRMGELHLKKQGLRYFVADIQQIYNEFSSGTADPTAIRDFVKMLYDKAGTDISKKPKYLLLFGDASYDYKNRITSNSNIIPAYQSSSSLDLLTTYTSDDFFGFLDDHEDINSFTTQNLLDIGIGRIPVSTIEDARNVVNKIESYGSSFGPWRTQLTFVADDEDQNIHVNDAEHLSKTSRTTNNILHHQKIYLDAYPQESGAGGARYPQVNEEINRYMFNGNLIWNYSGHGGYKRLAEEAILEESMITKWKNEHKLPLFITATCDFAPYDNPQIKSIGEELLLTPKQGAIALMTTTRAVFAFANRIINTNYLSTALARQTDGSYLSLGEAVKRSKNYTYQTISDAINNRKFTLLGDPALVLGFPQHNIVTTAINDIPVTQFKDTLRALNQYTISGQVQTHTGTLMSQFNGRVVVSFYDKAQLRSTRVNDPGSNKEEFEQQQNILFKGKTEVKDGRFRFSFIIPKDIDLKNGFGRLTYYAENGSMDAAGADEHFIIGGLGNQIPNDKQGPLLKGYLNDELFVNGGIVNENSILLVSLADTSGLNTTGTGIGHDMIAILDDNTNNIFVLNDFFEAEINSFRKGKIRFPLPTLEEGLHTLKIRAWDVFNNPSEITITFKVVKQRTFEIHNVRCYPNPFKNSTRFSLEHNRNNEELAVNITIYSISGQFIRTINQTVKTVGNRFEWEWDGTNGNGISVSSGLYTYSVVVKSNDGQVKNLSGKLIKY